MLELRSISFSYQNNVIFKNLSHSFKKGEITAIVGRSGVGKSTLFSLLSGQQHPNNGIAIINGAELTKLPSNKRPVITMFQQESLFPHMTIYENIRFPLVSKYNRNRFNDIDHKTYIAERLKEVDLSGFEERLPHTLSGGQKQRATLARSLAAKPEILLLDEPFGALNEELKYTLNQELGQIVKANNIVALKVTHDINEAINFSDSILFLDHGLNFKFKTTEIETLKAPAEVIDYFMLGLLTEDKTSYFPMSSLNEKVGDHLFSCEILSAFKRGGRYDYTLRYQEQQFKYFSDIEYKKTVTLYADNKLKLNTLHR